MKIWKKRITQSVKQLINDGGVCRTAPATLGLLIIGPKKFDMSIFWREKFCLNSEVQPLSLNTSREIESTEVLGKF